jgi:hypothetical protein
MQVVQWRTVGGVPILSCLYHMPLLWQKLYAFIYLCCFGRSFSMVRLAVLTVSCEVYVDKGFVATIRVEICTRT